MPRNLRIFCHSKIYHIILKGIDNQDIFYDNQDRYVFLENIKKSQKNYTYNVLAYCLMNNHVHMVIQVENDLLSKAIQSLTIRYVYYFNKKYDREGPFVRNRFKSKIIENPNYFLKVCRYVHRNPEKANINKTEKYKWSSYNDYISGKGITKTKILLHYFNNNINDFVKFTLQKESLEEISNEADFELISRLTDDQLIKIIKERFNLMSFEDVPKFIKGYSKEEKENIIKNIDNIVGTNPRQMARVIGINRKLIYKILKRQK